MFSITLNRNYFDGNVKTFRTGQNFGLVATFYRSPTYCSWKE